MPQARPAVRERATTAQTLKVEGLDVVLGERELLTNVTFEVAAGELVVIVGENGAGKSTLTAVLAGALKPTRGTVEVLGQPPSVPFKSGELAAVWQTPALVEELRVVDNLFLGREPGLPFLGTRRMRTEAAQAFAELGLDIPLHARVSDLSGGERQLLALAGAVMRRPRVLLLDEPTTALGLTAQARVDDMLRDLRAAGTTILLVSHRLEQVTALADRVLALRHGKLVVDATTVELTPDDIVALMSGLPGGLSSRNHLTQLSGLVDQLSEVEPSASLPLIVSAFANTAGQQQVCVHLTDPKDEQRLVLAASVGLPEDRLRGFRRVKLGEASTVSEAYRTARPALRNGREDVPRAAWEPMSMWSVPLMGNRGCYGVISGLADVPGTPQPDQMEIMTVYASLAATALERERLLEKVTASNRVLESLRRVLEPLAVEADEPIALRAAMRVLHHELEARHLVLLRLARDQSGSRVIAEGPAGPLGPGSARDLRDALIGPPPYYGGALEGPLGTVRDLGKGVREVVTENDSERLVLAAEWRPGDPPVSERLDLLRAASYSLTLSAERDRAQEAMARARAATQASEVQREFVRRLSHELRTPLTAIVGYASTLRQPDVEWQAEVQRRFIDVMANEAGRLQRLVKDLLDSATIATGTMPINPDWCDLDIVVEAAVSAIGHRSAQVTTHPGDLPAVWGDHDRLEQVLINVIDNAFRHGAGHVDVSTALTQLDGQPAARVDIEDDGPGVNLADHPDLFEPYIRGATEQPGLGLGLAISRAIARAHQGTLAFVPVTRGATVRLTIPVDPPAGENEGKG